MADAGGVGAGRDERPVMIPMGQQDPAAVVRCCSGAVGGGVRPGDGGNSAFRRIFWADVSSAWR